MGVFRPEPGTAFGRWIVIREDDPDVNKNGKPVRRFLCRCECGVVESVLRNSLRYGASKSCGCLSRDVRKASGKTKGLHTHPLYHCWNSAIQRTENPKDRKWEHYGGRGLSVCDEWRNDFLTFYNWAMAHGYRRGLQIDRIDNDEGYSPDNCRFVTSATNNRNRRGIKLTFEKAEEVRRLYKKGMSAGEIASIFPVSLKMIRLIIRGENWLPAT